MHTHCAGCGTYCDGDVCSSRCEQIATDAKRWAGREPCEKCMETRDDADWEPATHGDLCEVHEDQRNEAAYERFVEGFYGG